MSEGAGKGDAYRPVDQKKYAENYDRIKWHASPVTWYPCPVCGAGMNYRMPCPNQEEHDNKAANRQTAHD